KVLAAHRNGLTTVILPKGNQQDAEETPDEVKRVMKLIFVETVDEALSAALEPKRATRMTKNGKAKRNAKNSAR
ncbi:MAG TPA: endopeptidase La, partial [Anaerolineales bacterium]|nr:endopeptidase La [Anaerolineales bacterium]